VANTPGIGGGPEVLVQRLHDDATLPVYALPGDAGADLTTVEGFTLAPLERKVVPTGIAIALPAGYAAFVHPRSGLAAKQGITVVNAPGTIDAGYRGEVKVVLANTDSSQEAVFQPGDKIAQLVIQPVETAQFITAERLPGSVRSHDGFGSTGRGLTTAT
jgi:dUTP pyrophosphatase